MEELMPGINPLPEYTQYHNGKIKAWLKVIKRRQWTADSKDLTFLKWAEWKSKKELHPSDYPLFNQQLALAKKQARTRIVRKLKSNVQSVQLGNLLLTERNP